MYKSGLGNIIQILKSKYPLAIIEDGLAIKGHEVNQSNINNILINWLKFLKSLVLHTFFKNKAFFNISADKY